MTADSPRRTVFDIGMYDGEDTAYYLSLGFSVIAVEANPVVAQAGRERFRNEISAGRLTIENVAIGSEHGEMSFHICAGDLGASSVMADRLKQREAIGEVITVPAVPLGTLFGKHGVPYYLKVDIEGADRYAILALTRNARPQYVSFEMDPDADELIRHLDSLGYTRFKLISQSTFGELSSLESLTGKLERRALGLLGAERVWRAGRLFKRYHSSGPLPERTGGDWRNVTDVRHQWSRYRQETPSLGGWCDLHASIA